MSTIPDSRLPRARGRDFRLVDGGKASQLVWLIVVGGLTVVFLGSGVNGNIRYQVGVSRVSGYSAAETFSHRPIAFRLLNAGQSWLPELISRGVGPPGSLSRVLAFEGGFRLLAVLAAAAAALLLWSGLRRRWGETASPYAVAAYAALVFVSPAIGEPDWMAALLSVAAVGAGLMSRPGVGGSIAGALLALAAVVKISTLPVAVAALIVLWAIDRSRGQVALVGSIVAGLTSILLVLLFAPYEIVWLLDIRALQPDPWSETSAADAGNYLMNLASRWPSVALVPAFFVLATRREAFVAAASLTLTALAFVMQGQYFIYHAMGFVVLSTVLAVRTILRSNAALRWPLIAWSLWTLVLFATPAEWRLAHPFRLYAITGAGMVGLVAAQWLALRRPPTADPARVTRWASVLVVFSLAATQLPFSAESLTLNTAGRTTWSVEASLQADLEVAQQVHSLIGADTAVTYLAFGDTAYLLGNPTHCRYPSQLFLQRKNAAQLVSPSTRAQSLACLGDPSAEWLIWDRGWLHRKNAPADLIAAIDTFWDCDLAAVIGGYTVCPRRR